MQVGKNLALERFMEAVDKEPEANTPAAPTSLIGGVTVMRGHVIVIGDCSPQALEAILQRRAARKSQ